MKLTSIKFSLILGFKLGSVATVNKTESAYVRCISE